jgi:hypothetical protein
VTIERVQKSERATQENDEGLWLGPLLLWPECLTIAISTLSSLLSLRTILTNKFINLQKSCCDWDLLCRQAIREEEWVGIIY